MPTDTGFSRPTLQQIIERVTADISSRIPGADTQLRRNALHVLGRTMSSGEHGLYGFLDFIAKQAFPDTATAEFMERWASIWLTVPRKAATKANGPLTITGIDGSAINTGTRLIRGDDVEYVTTTAGVISSESVVLQIQCDLPGTIGNLEAGQKLTFVSPISGVDAEATTGIIAQGTDTETDEALLARLLQRIKQPPHGGAKFDYETWALEVEGVTRAWAYPHEMGIGTVSVRFMMDDTYDDGIPESADVDEVAAWIEIYRPVTAAEIYVVAPIATPLNFTIALKKKDGSSESSPTIRSVVEAELTDLIRREAIPGGTLLISHIREAISVAAGEYDHILTTPSANVTHTTGQIATPGSFTFT